MKRLLLSAVAALGFSGQAFAADFTERAYAKAPPLQQIYGWSGFYIGANVGYGWSNQVISIAGTPPYDAFVGCCNDPTIAGNPKGALGGAQIGYNFQVNTLLLGLEADLAGAGIQKQQNDTRDGYGAFAGFGPFTTIGEQKIDLFGTVRGRLGVVIDNLLIYGTGGLAYGHASVSHLTSNRLGACFYWNCTSGSTDKMLLGSTFGGGVEWGFAKNWSAKAEYLYYDLGNISYVAPNLPNPVNPYHVSSNFKGNIVRLGLNYKLSPN